MAKNQRKKVKSKILHHVFTKIPNIVLGDDLLSPDPFQGFPVPPFVSWTINTDRISYFCRNILDSLDQVVWIGKDDVIQLLEFFYTESVSVQTSRRFHFCPSSNPEYLLRLKKSIDTTKSVYFVLGRKLDELDLIKLVMLLRQENVVLVGPDVGVLSEYARLLFIPFYPIENQNCRFWHHSELLYLPLQAMEIPIKDILEGCTEGFLTQKNLAISIARSVYSLQRNGIQRTYFIVDTYPFFSLLKALSPLLEEMENENGDYLKAKILTLEALKGDYLEHVLSSDKKDLFFILNQNKTGQALKTPVYVHPIVKENLFSGKELLFLDKKRLFAYNEATIEALQHQIKKNGSSFIQLQYPNNDLFSFGLMEAFFYYYSCYSSWLKGYDVLNDPPFAEFDQLIWKYLR